MDGGGGTGAASFQMIISPLVSQMQCTSGGACHTLQAPILTSFEALGPNYKTKPGMMNILVTKGALTGGLHSGLPYFDAAQQSTVAMWIDSL